MSFDVPADSYERFMGRWSRPLASAFVGGFELSAGHRVVDVGCGPGVLTDALIDVVGSASVFAVDPSASFVRATQERCGVPVVAGLAERLPFRDSVFDAALAQLVVHFMSDPVAGLREMARVTVAGGLVAASVWDHGERGGGPLSMFWRVARELDSSAPDESARAGVRRGHLAELATAAGLTEVVETALTIEAAHPGFDDWWEPFTLGVGQVGSYIAGLTTQQREALRQGCRDQLPAGRFVTTAKAWTVVAVSPG